MRSPRALAPFAALALVACAAGAGSRTADHAGPAAAASSSPSSSSASSTAARADASKEAARLICTDGVLGPPEDGGSDAPFGEGGLGLSGIEPRGADGLGTLSGGREGTAGGLGYVAVRDSVVGRPVDALGARGLALAVGACAATTAILGCRASTTVQGDVLLEVTIAPDGAPTRVERVAGTIADPGVVACVIDAVRAQRFDRAAAGLARYRWDLSLRAKEPPYRVREGAVQVGGRLPPEVVRRVVRQSLPRLRACYEKGIARDATLKGTVPIAFTIGPDGAIGNVRAEGGTLVDKDLRACLVGVFGGLSFPEPEGGSVLVSYPLELEYVP
jgi:hypothetical protein